MWFVLDQLKFEIFDLMSSTLKQVSMTATIANAANPISNMKRLGSFNSTSDRVSASLVHWLQGRFPSLP